MYLVTFYPEFHGSFLCPASRTQISVIIPTPALSCVGLRGNALLQRVEF